MGLFWKQGYAGTGLADLEAATDLGRQSLYGAFGDKRALFERVVERYFDTVLRPGLIDPLDKPGLARANIERVLRQAGEYAAAPGFDGCLVGNSAAELGLHDPTMADLLRRKLALVEEAFYRAILRAQRAGEIRRSTRERSPGQSLRPPRGWPWWLGSTATAPSSAPSSTWRSPTSTEGRTVA